jgi:hypothetical protein
MPTRADRISSIRIAEPREFGAQGGKVTPVCFNVIHYPNGTRSAPGQEYWIVGPTGLHVSAEKNIRCDSHAALGRFVAELAAAEA